MTVNRVVFATPWFRAPLDGVDGSKRRPLIGERIVHVQELPDTPAERSRTGLDDDAPANNGRRGELDAQIMNRCALHRRRLGEEVPIERVEK